LTCEVQAMRALWLGPAAVIAALAGLSPPPAAAQQPPAAAQQPDAGQPGVEVLTSGPMHEAYARPTEVRPEAPPVVPKQPPEPIEEVAPDQKPEGDNVVWIPGYWAWDEDRSDYIWVSGFWRDVPPGRTWVPGCWQQAQGGWQWV